MSFDYVKEEFKILLVLFKGDLLPLVGDNALLDVTRGGSAAAKRLGAKNNFTGHFGALAHALCTVRNTTRHIPQKICTIIIVAPSWPSWPPASCVIHR